MDPDQPPQGAGDPDSPDRGNRWGLSASRVLLDHDNKFTDSFSFDAVFEAEGAKVQRVGPKAPNMNAYAAERWVQTFRS